MNILNMHNIKCAEELEEVVSIDFTAGTISIRLLDMIYSRFELNGTPWD
jgi:hypothetical protein